MAQTSTNNNQSNTIAEIRNSTEYDFAYCFRPFHYISRIFGYMPFSIIFDSKNAICRPTIRVFDILWFIVATFLYISMAIVCARFLKNSYTSSTVLSDGDRLILIVSIVFGFLLIVMDMYNRFKFVDMLNKFKRSDEEVRSISHFSTPFLFLFSPYCSNKF